MTRCPSILHDLSACHLTSRDDHKPGGSRAMRMLVPAADSETPDPASRLHLLPQTGFDWMYTPLFA